MRYALAKRSGTPSDNMSVALDRREQKAASAMQGGLEATPGIEPGYTVLQTVA